jgi:hypothetical protein
MLNKVRRPSPAMVVALVALVLSMAGTGYAAVSLAPNSVGARQLKRNAVTSTKIKDRSIATRDLSAAARRALTGKTGATGATGPAGAQGAKGDKGDPGANGVSLFAAVKSDGTLVNGTPGTQVVKNGTGSYVVGFTAVVTPCAAVVTQGGVPAYPVSGGASTPAATGPGRATLTTGGGTYAGLPSDHTVLVSTSMTSGAAVDTSFHLIVAC